MNKQLVVGDQSFDVRLDFFLCPTHGLFVPFRFNAEWTTDEGCPVLTCGYDETCGEDLMPVFLDSLVRAEAQSATTAEPSQEEYETESEEIEEDDGPLEEAEAQAEIHADWERES